MTVVGLLKMPRKRTADAGLRLEDLTAFQNEVKLRLQAIAQKWRGGHPEQEQDARLQYVIGIKPDLDNLCKRSRALSP
jgi:hypothetical protein